MTIADISNFRFRNQHISSPGFKSAREVLNFMGALQAQDFQMSKWAVGIRLNNSTDKAIETEFDRGEILRTHLLRPTWHLVSAENTSWMLKLTAPVIKAGLKTRRKELELSESLLKKANIIIQDSLKGGNHLTREELIVILSRHKIYVEKQRAYHLLVCAELDGIICSGRIKSGKQTYALLNERIHETPDLTKNEALKKLAGMYFKSRGPATLQDFKWWSGLSAADSKNALEIIRPDMSSEKTGTELYWFFDLPDSSGEVNNTAHFLPAFDEFLISYRNRTASLQSVNFKKAVSDNGIFRPVIVLDGQVVGLWRRTIKKKKAIVETELFKPGNKVIKRKIVRGLEAYGFFAEKETELKYIIS
jgi:hypothetical protein